MQNADHSNLILVDRVRNDRPVLEHHSSDAFPEVVSWRPSIGKFAKRPAKSFDPDQIIVCRDGIGGRRNPIVNLIKIVPDRF